MPVEADVVGRQSEPTGDLVAGRRPFEALGQSGKLEVRDERPALPPPDEADDVADRLLQNDAQIPVARECRARADAR